jgi:hypothetical protein
MKQEITYKIIEQKELSQYESDLLDLIDPEKKRPKEILRSLRNSNIIMIALD